MAGYIGKGQSQSLTDVPDVINHDVDFTGVLKLGGIPVAAFPSGTTMLFHQSTAPTGWTKNTSHDNKALRVVSGSIVNGGTDSFTAVFATRSLNGTVGGTAITTAQMPAHNHGVSDPGHSHGVADGGHGHSMRYGTPNGDYYGMYTGAGEGGWAIAAGSGNNNITRTRINNSGTGIGIYGSGTGISINNNGSGQTHTHSLSMNSLNLNVQYVDVIIATKD
jgi:hypothetical protein